MKLIIPNKVKALTDFAAQIVFGSMAFAVVFVAALLLSLLIRWGSQVTSAPAWLDTSAGYVGMAGGEPISSFSRCLFCPRR